MTPHYNYEGNEADGKKVKEFLPRNKEIEALIFIKPFLSSIWQIFGVQRSEN